MMTIIAGMSCAGKDTIQNYLLQKDYRVMILSSKKTHRLACWMNCLLIFIVKIIGVLLILYYNLCVKYSRKEVTLCMKL